MTIEPLVVGAREPPARINAEASSLQRRLAQLAPVDGVVDVNFSQAAGVCTRDCRVTLCRAPAERDDQCRWQWDAPHPAACVRDEQHTQTPRSRGHSELDPHRATPKKMYTGTYEGLYVPNHPKIKQNQAKTSSKIGSAAFLKKGVANPPATWAS